MPKQAEETAFYFNGKIPALVLVGKGKIAEARDALNQVVTKYPHSDAAGLARAELKTLPK